jgi:hypothetical protein
MELNIRINTTIVGLYLQEQTSQHTIYLNEPETTGYNNNFRLFVKDERRVIEDDENKN